MNFKVDDIDSSPTAINQVKEIMLSAPKYLSIDIGLIFAVIAMIVIIRKKISYKSGLIMALIIGLTPIAIEKVLLGKERLAITLETTKTREGPSAVFQETGELAAGSKIIVRDNSDGWYLVVAPSQLAGWVEKNRIGLY